MKDGQSICQRCAKSGKSMLCLHAHFAKSVLSEKSAWIQFRFSRSGFIWAWEATAGPICWLSKAFTACQCIRESDREVFHLWFCPGSHPPSPPPVPRPGWPLCHPTPSIEPPLQSVTLDALKTTFRDRRGGKKNQTEPPKSRKSQPRDLILDQIHDHWMMGMNANLN